MNTPWQIVEHSWEATSLYDAKGNRVCTFSLHDLGEVTESNQEQLEAKQRQRVLSVLNAVNKEVKP